MTSTISAQPQDNQSLKLVLLHLLPGLLTGGFYFLVRRPLIGLGFPPVFALTVSAIVILIPFELGFLLYQGRKTTGRWTLDGVIAYRRPIRWWEYPLWVVLVFLVTGAVFTLMKPVGEFLQNNLFSWMPAMGTGLDGTYSRSALILTYALFFIIIAVAAPLVEELYFRGYLLPRMPGNAGALLHSFLFATYHFFSPWMVVTRTIGLLPMIYAVRKKNIYIGMIVHVVLNSLDVMTAAVFIAHMV